MTRLTSEHEQIRNVTRRIESERVERKGKHRWQATRVSRETDQMVGEQDEATGTSWMVSTNEAGVVVTDRLGATADGISEPEVGGHSRRNG